MVKELERFPQAANRLGVKVPTLRKWVREGRVPVIRLSARALRFDPRALDKFIAQNTVEAR
jgi:excisionase family DNA binding protein